mmetsp:Transcript_591/g.1369  ORF Transcript_591/g.1369 Transcript_591/m.1369 type:complete len:127 (+) Transcript_591:163-543(+)
MCGAQLHKKKASPPPCHQPTCIGTASEHNSIAPHPSASAVQAIAGRERSDAASSGAAPPLTSASWRSRYGVPLGPANARTCIARERASAPSLCMHSNTSAGTAVSSSMARRCVGRGAATLCGRPEP